MVSKRISQQDLDEWRAAPVAQGVRKCLQQALSLRKEALLASYYRGQQEPESYRQALLLAEGMLEDWFEASADDFAALMESNDGK